MGVEFKVGDKVRYIKVIGVDSGVSIGTILTVDDVINGYIGIVEWPDDWFYPEELTHYNKIEDYYEKRA